MEIVFFYPAFCPVLPAFVKFKERSAVFAVFVCVWRGLQTEESGLWDEMLPKVTDISYKDHI